MVTLMERRKEEGEESEREGGEEDKREGCIESQGS